MAPDPMNSQGFDGRLFSRHGYQGQVRRTCTRNMRGIWWAHPGPPTLSSAELFRSLKVSDRRRNAPKSAQYRSESLCAGLWAPCRIFWAWFGQALGPNPVRSRRFPAGSYKDWVAFRIAQQGASNTVVSPMVFAPSMRTHYVFVGFLRRRHRFVGVRQGLR